jgi:hypothetical protein
MAFRPDAFYVASSGSGAVQRYDRLTGAPLGNFAFGSGMSRPVAMSWDAAGGFWWWMM